MLADILVLLGLASPLLLLAKMGAPAHKRRNRRR